MISSSSIKSLTIVVLLFFLYQVYKEKKDLIEEKFLLQREIVSLNNDKEKLKDDIKAKENEINDEVNISKIYNDYYVSNLINKKFTGNITTYYTNGQKHTIGFLANGKERGTWTTFNNDGEIVEKYYYNYECVGALCNDGTKSGSTGRGTCSWHGGVATWLYDYVKIYTFPKYYRSYW